MKVRSRALLLWLLDRLFLSLLRPMHRSEYSEIHDACCHADANPIGLIFWHAIYEKEDGE